MKIDLTAKQLYTIRQALNLAAIVNGLSSLVSKNEADPLVKKFDDLLGDPLIILQKAEMAETFKEYWKNDQTELAKALKLAPFGRTFYS